MGGNSSYVFACFDPRGGWEVDGAGGFASSGSAAIDPGRSLDPEGMLPELLVMHLALPLMDHEYAVHNATSAAGEYATDAAGSSRRICFWAWINIL